MQRRHFIRAAAAAAVPLSAAHAQDAPAAWPQRNLTVVVPYPPGGNADGVARVFATALAEVVHKPVVVENKPGASGTIGANLVARAPADAHTLLLTPSSQLYNTLLDAPPPYDPVRSFAPVIGLTTNPLVLGAPAGLGVHSVQELAARAKETRLNYGSFGHGNVTHVLLHVLDRQMGGHMMHVPYKGEMQMLNDMLSGVVHAGLFSPGLMREMEQAGKVKALATVGVRRSAFLPQVPTFPELGYSQLDWLFSSTVYTSSATPPALLARLEAAADQVARSKAVQDALAQRGSEFWGAGSAEVRAQIASTTRRWAQLVAELGKLR